MTFRKFVKSFAWEALLPVCFFAAAGIFTACMYSEAESSPASYTYAAGVMLFFAGIPAVVGGLLGRRANVFLLLAGAGGAAAAVWLFVPNTFSGSVVPLALGILLILRAGAEVLQAVTERKSGAGKLAVKLVFAAIFLAAGVVSCVDPFAGGGGWVFAGVFLAAQSLYDGLLLAYAGFFTAEEGKKSRGER